MEKENRAETEPCMSFWGKEKGRAPAPLHTMKMKLDEALSTMLDPRRTKREYIVLRIEKRKEKYTLLPI